MVTLAAPPRIRPSPLPHRVRVAEPDQRGAVRRVQRQRVAEPVWPFRSRFGSQHDKLHSVSDFSREQRVTVKVEPGVEPRIAVSHRHQRKLSMPDNE